MPTTTPITIRLRRQTDPNEPTLEGEPIDFNQNGQCVCVRVISKHPIWHGCELDRAHWRSVRGIRGGQDERAERRAG